MIKLFMALVIVLTSTPARAWSLFGPNTYDDCVLENVKNAQSPQAVAAVKQSCKEKFEKKRELPKEIELPLKITQSLDGKAGMDFGFQSKWNGYFLGQVFNKSSDFIVTAVVVRITDNKTNEFNEYFTKLEPSGNEAEVRPLTIGTFGFKPFEVPEDRSWLIVKAYGYKIE